MFGTKLRGTIGNDMLTGTVNDDTIYGGAGNDFVFGGGGDDFIYGGAGNDYLYGGDGNDWIVAGAGRDQMHGGNGADAFVFFKTPYDRDTVMDFRADQGDYINFVGAISPREITYHDTDLGIVIQYGGMNGNAENHSEILLLNVHELQSNSIFIG